jgi:hypothetical protein
MMTTLLTMPPQARRVDRKLATQARPSVASCTPLRVPRQNLAAAPPSPPHSLHARACHTARAPRTTALTEPCGHAGSPEFGLVVTPILCYWAVAIFYDVLDTLDLPITRKFKVVRKVGTGLP